MRDKFFFYKEQALKVKEKLQQSDKDKRVVSFNWLSDDLKKRTAPSDRFNRVPFFVSNRPGSTNRFKRTSKIQ